MTPANFPPVLRAALLVTLALLSSLAVTSSSSWGSTGGKRTSCDPRTGHGNRSPAARRHKSKNTACTAHHRVGGGHAIDRQRVGPTTETPGGGVGPDTSPPLTIPVLSTAAEVTTTPPPPATPLPPLEPPPPPPDPAPEPPASDLLPTPHSIYWGAWIKNPAGEAPWSMTAASQFEQLAGKAVSVINWSSPFYLSDCNGYCAFRPTQFNAVRNHGAIPFFSWNPGPGTGAFTDAQIAAGAQDSYIAAWAQAAKQWGHPFFLRFAWEMNGAWFPWGVDNNGTTAADYVAMWRHVHDVFASAGATNVTWVWCPNIDPYGHHAPMAGIYPGDAYVDWTCLDGYNGADPWKSFSGLFKSSYEAITGTIAPDKPMIVGETASTEASGSKAEWIADALGELPTAFPKIRGLLWFDKVEAGPGDQTDWPIESSTAASSAFAAGIQDPVYAGNEYGDLAVSPIPAP